MDKDQVNEPKKTFAAIPSNWSELSDEEQNAFAGSFIDAMGIFPKDKNKEPK